jgi:peroxiredoxin
MQKDEKQNIIEQYIKPAFGSASAYYALTLTVGGSPIFNPMQNRDDSKWLAAVATNFQNTHPGTRHTAYLTEVAKKGLEATRQPRTVEIELEESEALTTGMFNINLPQPSGDSIALSSFVGKVVMLDFTFYESTEMGSRNILMRELHNKYRNKGFDIYQVSLDKNKDFWKQSAANLPWTCVHDTFGISAQLYNVEVLPTFFLIGKNGEVLLRDTQIEDIGKEIEKHLNK